MIQKLSVYHFTHDKWRIDEPLYIFGIRWREEQIIARAKMLRQYAVGYCKGENLLIKPKKNTFAIMFFKDENHFWFHMTDREFQEVFKREDKK